MKLGKILIVEDSELLHRMYDLIFMRYRNDGCQLIHAFNGQQALQKLASNTDVGLILLDINMPVMSGLEFLQHCRRQRIFEEIPVIIISTEGSAEDTIRGLEAGAKGYVTKPFQTTELLGLVFKVLAAHESSLRQSVPGEGAQRNRTY